MPEKNWYCPTCQIEVPPLHVTFYEEHDTRFGGCGNRVQPDSPEEFKAAIKAAVLEEREACALICRAGGAYGCEERIRARSQS